MDRDERLPLGEYLRGLRRSHQLTLRAVQEQTGISNAYLSQVESGKIRQPSPITLFKLAELYGGDYDDLLRRAGHPVPKAATEQDDVLSANSRFGRLSPDEEQALLDYLNFIRARSKRGGGLS